jgi:hypothetical protein
MNDEQLIWEAYTKKKKNQNPYRQEVDRVMEMGPNAYNNWKKELNDKLNQVEFDSPEYNHLIGLERALGDEYHPSQKLWDEIENEVNRETSHRNPQNKFREDLFHITANAQNNAEDYQNTPSYYRRCIGSLESGLADSEYSTPEVREWFKTKFGIVG